MSNFYSTGSFKRGLNELGPSLANVMQMGKPLPSKYHAVLFYDYHKAAKREWGCSFLYFISLMQKIRFAKQKIRKMS